MDDEMKMKWMLIPVLMLLIGFVAFVGWYRWDSSQNRGYTFGYYGEFNAVGNALAAIPGVTVCSGKIPMSDPARACPMFAAASFTGSRPVAESMMFRVPAEMPVAPSLTVSNFAIGPNA